MTATEAEAGMAIHRRADVMRDQATPVAWAATLQAADTLAMVEAALHARRVRLAFQPVVQARDPARILFHEGFARILDETGRAIPARDFMAAVETSELGRRIDAAVLDLGLAALCAHRDLRLSVNMSARSVGWAPFTRTLTRALAADRSLGPRLVLEISEASAMLMPDIVTAFMDDMRLSGVTFALDDFGSGFTSFRHLRDFCFDLVKIDGAFVRGVDRNPDNLAVARALVAVAGSFEMAAVAEAVETAAEAAMLARIGVSAMQGMLFGMPTVTPAWAETPR
jgi:EAL domain-containing protein (putative c-di-GMP-specific phosphodiesterase class I)